MSTSPLDTLFQELRGREFLYCPNPGNAGDVFITCSSYRYFDARGCRYECITPDCPPERTRGRIVVYGGGGALVPLYGMAARFLRAHHAGAAQLIVLPHTIRGHEELLGELGPNVHLFCRELPSLEHVKRHASRARAELADDMALGFDCAAAAREARERFWPVFSTPQLAWRNTKRLLRSLPAIAAGSARLHAVRTDSEKTDVPIPRGNVDVSHVFNVTPVDPLRALEATWRMMRFIDRFDAVTTNRLHVCIMAALLGKHVDFLPNSYGKNRAVYEHSMARRFPHVVWQEGMASEAAAAAPSHEPGASA